jgi:hypothetical protein
MEQFTVKFTVKIKDEHNPPEFKEGMGKGVVATQEIVIKPRRDNDETNSAVFIMETADLLLRSYFEVNYEIIEEETKS